MKIKIIFLFIVLAAAPMALAAQKKSAAQVVQEFYTFHSAADKTFNKAAIEARRKWFSEALYKLFLNELKRQDEFLKKNPSEKPFYGDGLALEPREECTVGNNLVPNILRVQSAEISGGAAIVPVKFYNPQQCGGDPLTSYEVKLVRSDNKWLIDDWIFDDGKTLTSELQRKEY